MILDPINPERQELPKVEEKPKPDEKPKAPEPPAKPDEEAKRDDSFISTASNEDMFAFSQVIAQGGSIAKTVDKIEKEAAVEK